MQVEQQEQEDKVDEEQYLEEEEVKFLSPLFPLAPLALLLHRSVFYIENRMARTLSRSDFKISLPR